MKAPVPGAVVSSPLASYNALLGKVFLANAQDRHRYHPNGPRYYGVDSLRKARCFAVGFWLLQTYYPTVWTDVNAAAERLLQGPRDGAWRPGAQ